VPIIALEDRLSGLKCDICMCNRLALLNSRLLKTYTQLDPRLRILAYTIKSWAKRRCINDPYRGSPSSYAYVLLVIHYLQTVNPPVLPVLQELRGGEWSDDPDQMFARTPDGRAFDCSFCADVEGVAAALQAVGTPNTASVGELLVGFFHRYQRDFDWPKGVVSVRTGLYLNKQEKKWTTKEKGFRGDRHLFSIEDPFEITHDLGRVLDRETLGEVRQEFERANTMLSNERSLDALLAPWQEAAPAKEAGAAKAAGVADTQTTQA